MVPVGVEAVSNSSISPKASDPLFVYVGRLAPSKRLGDIIAAFAMFRRGTGRGRLELIGTGPERYVSQLRQDVVRRGLASSVQFPGWLSGDDKHRRLSQARALLMASVREGWGLVVTEANACGTPAIVYDVPGLRDSVKHKSTGLIVEASPVSMCASMLALCHDDAAYQAMAIEAKRWAESLVIEETATRVESLVQAAVASDPNSRISALAGTNT